MVDYSRVTSSAGFVYSIIYDSKSAEVQGCFSLVIHFQFVVDNLELLIKFGY